MARPSPVVGPESALVGRRAEMCASWATFVGPNNSGVEMFGEHGLSRPHILLNVGLTRTRVPTATPEDDRGEKAEPRRYALLTLIRHCVGGEGAFLD